MDFKCTHGGNFLLIGLVLLLFCRATSVSSTKVATDTGGETNYVPNAETAIKVAEAVLIPVYGKKYNCSTTIYSTLGI
jgi:hypothetical protein